MFALGDKKLFLVSYEKDGTLSIKLVAYIMVSHQFNQFFKLLEFIKPLEAQQLFS